MRIGLAANRHLLHHLDAVAFESNHLLRIVRQETKLSHAEIKENLRSQSVVPQITGKTELGICLHRIETFFLELIGMDFRGQPDAAALLSHIHKYTGAFLRNLLKRRV